LTSQSDKDDPGGVLHGREILHSFILTELGNVARVTLAIDNVTREDAGIYEIVFTVPTRQIDLSCCPEYRDLVFHYRGMKLQNFIMGLATVELKIAGMFLTSCFFTECF